MSDGESSSGGISFLGALALLFIGLKLGGVIDWSWWLVLLPIYGPLAAVIALFCVIGIVACLMAVFKG